MTSLTSPSDTIRLKSRLSMKALASSRSGGPADRRRPTSHDQQAVATGVDTPVTAGSAGVDVVDRPAADRATTDERLPGVTADQIIDLTGHEPRVLDADRPAVTPRPIDVPVRGPIASVVARAFDITVAIVGLLVLAPLMLVVALAVVIDSPGPVFYGSPRLGRQGTTFRAWKFRSMRPQADLELARLLEGDPRVRNEFEQYHKLRRDPRLTRIGAIIRQGSLDELPQLINILVGEMSVVGPRPKLARDAEAYGEHLDAVLSVRPGLTGLWQVSGRNRLPMADRVTLDLRYLEQRSLRGDLVIVLRTFVQLWRPRKHGAY